MLKGLGGGSPEACRGEIGSPADVWGLAATTYHAMVGQVPYPRPRGARDSEDPTVRFPQLVEQQPPLPGGLDPQLAELLLGALSRNPADRPTAAEMAVGLEPVVEALPPPPRAREGGRAHPLSETATRRRATTLSGRHLEGWQSG